MSIIDTNTQTTNRTMSQVADAITTMEHLAMDMPAAELNNCAIAYWQAGCHQEATVLFHIAVANLRDQCRLEPLLVSDEEGKNALDLQLVEDTVKEATSWMSKTAHPCVSIEMPHDDCFVVCYTHAVLLDTSARYQDDALLASTVMFNMALLHHSTGLEWRHPVVLEQACRLYHLSMGLLNGLDKSNSNTLLYLATLNNIANIDSCLRRKESMMASLDKMCQILVATDGIAGHDTAWTDYYLVFSINVMVGQLVTFTIAPAA
jgi:hypothetical protein